MKKDLSPNNTLLQEVKIAEVRAEIEAREKEHYQKMLATMKQQMTLTLKD